MIRLASVIGSKDYSSVNVTCEKYLSPDDRFMKSIHVDSIASQDWIYLAGVCVYACCSLIISLPLWSF
jgi:hypothetical protein